MSLVPRRRPEVDDAVDDQVGVLPPGSEGSPDQFLAMVQAFEAAEDHFRDHDIRPQA
jgi:hypothetical protein